MPKNPVLYTNKREHYIAKNERDIRVGLNLHTRHGNQNFRMDRGYLMFALAICNSKRISVPALSRQ